MCFVQRKKGFLSLKKGIPFFLVSPRGEICPLDLFLVNIVVGLPVSVARERFLEVTPAGIAGQQGQAVLAAGRERVEREVALTKQSQKLVEINFPVDFLAELVFHFSDEKSQIAFHNINSYTKRAAKVMKWYETTKKKVKKMNHMYGKN